MELDPTDVLVIVDTITKLDPSGQLLWSVINPGEPLAITSDPDGDAIVVGTFVGTTDFGTGPLVSAGGGDVYVTKLHP